MKKSSKEQEKLYASLAKEAEKDIEKNGTISWEEDGRREKKYTKQSTIQLHLATWLGKISKKFIKV